MKINKILITQNNQVYTHVHVTTHIYTCTSFPLQVVQNMFEMMDASRDTYESLVEQKRELEDLWQTEKDKAKIAQKVRERVLPH